MQDLNKRLRDFAIERDWEQFHSPKNLTMALSVEVAEIVEHFQWLTEEQSKNLPDDVLEAVGSIIAVLKTILKHLNRSMKSALKDSMAFSGLM